MNWTSKRTENFLEKKKMAKGDIKKVTSEQGKL